MCPGCGKVWTALQVLWTSTYVLCGAAQLIAGIFFLISVPALHLTCNIWTGSWNVIIGIVGGMLACFGQLSPRRQELLLYMAVSILVVNSVNVVLSEWGLYFADMQAVLKNYPNHMLIDYACFATRIATAVVIVVSFLDSQFSFCSMQISTRATPKPPDKKNKRKLHGSHEQVSDIEYIIPRPKATKPHSTVYNAYSQSWVFDAENAGGSSNSNNAESPYMKILENGGTPKAKNKSQPKNGVVQNGGVNDTAHLIDNPVVHIEEASDDSTSNSDRKLCHMKSFSRSASPVMLSASSSHISLNQQNPTGNPPIYECLETIYRSRLNTGSSTKEGDDSQYQAPQQTMVLQRVGSVSPHVEKVQYASLMKELQRAIGCKKEPSSVTSPQSTTSDSATTSEKTHTDSKSSSRHESSRSDGKSSDAEFSKELEAALQLIQDLESPNTIETPSEPKSSFDAGCTRPLAVWRNSDASEGSEKTLSAVGSLGEITSPLADCPPELSTFRTASTPQGNDGKGASILIRCPPDSQSTSGYSSPTHPNNTPSWSTTSSLNGSSSDIIAKPLSYSIHPTKSATVISLYSQTSPQSKSKSVTLVNFTAPALATKAKAKAPPPPPPPAKSPAVVNPAPVPATPVSSSPSWKSLLRKNKKQSPKLCPELEAAIVKSESLAYLSDRELLARHQRNTEIQRAIEEKVIQQLGSPRTESSC